MKNLIGAFSLICLLPADALPSHPPKPNPAPALEPIVRDRMENVAPLEVPLKVHLGWGSHWDEAK
jgi:hypothetical protein